MKLLYEYGKMGIVTARRNRITGKLEILLWKAGQQGHKTNYWHEAGAGHEDEFVTPDMTMLQLQHRLITKHNTVNSNNWN